MSPTAEPPVMSGKTRVLGGITVIDTLEVVAVGSLLHDPGLTNCCTGPRRFEIEGADAARDFAREQGLDDQRVEFHTFDRPVDGRL